MRETQPGDVVLLISLRDQKTFLRMLKPGEVLHTHNGYLAHDDLIGQPYGAKVRTHLGASFYLLSPTTEELIRYIRRKSQIIFPKDSGYILLKLGVRPGSRVLEAGSGSGGLTLALATAVGDAGHVYSYDVRADLQALAERNVHDAGLADRVTFCVRDAAEGFDETDVDALFLDLLAPWEVLDQAHAALAGGGVFGSLVPTMNQLITLMEALRAHPGFVFEEVEELSLRRYKTVPARMRPEDRMIAHTGYLVFSRAVVVSGGHEDEDEAGTGEADSDEVYPDEG
ncbi:MAG TPA: tRNA (adenine-N1)-methyltransferase [Aggregatilineales bacterium]|nr:tRNA (adenine-N1)-methyltransferase [Aggregatilineales bacterium]